MTVIELSQVLGNFGEFFGGDSRRRDTEEEQPE